MYDYLLTFRSLTYGQRAQKAIQDSGISASLIRTPKQLSENGCSYCIKIRRRDLEKSIYELNKVNISPVNIYKRAGDGSYEKVIN